MQIVSAFQLMQGYKMDKPFSAGQPGLALIQPIQMIPYEEKDDEWRASNMDWIETIGLDQIRIKHKRLTKNTQLAAGILDRNDYVADETNENKSIFDSLTRASDPPALTELKFFPLIPNIIDLLVGEFLKRGNRVIAHAVDEFSRNEKLDKKKELVNELLTQQAQMQIMQQLIDLGEDIESPEAQEQLSIENIQSLPDVEKFIRKNYRTVIEQWASHTMNRDRLRFRMDELEAIGFRDSIVWDQQVWEVMLLEDDYYPRVLDARHCFWVMAPNEQYISKANIAGHIEVLTISDVIDMYGYKMSEEEIRSLETILPERNAAFLLDLPNDGSYYDPTKSYEQNVKTGSLQYKKMMAFEDAFGPAAISNNRLFDPMILGDPVRDQNLLRVTTAYWKSQKRVGHLTSIDETGQLTQAIVSEDFVVTEKPLYDTTFYVDKTKDNLVYGEHIDWIWINEVWGGIKIGRNLPSTAVRNNMTNLDPIYLGIGDKKKPDRLSFQFRSNDSLYGTALPMEGYIGRSGSPVDRIKPFQISYNMVNNQISDILIDEIGTVIVIDQNQLPRHSLGEDWGKNNLARAYVAMKNFQILPLDTSLNNTEVATHFNGLQKLDASQTERLLGKVQLANYFKLEALASIGITPERMGSVNAQQTATGTQVAVNNSYAQTEKYFTQHSDFLMPRIWELLLNAAQYYQSQPNRSRTLSYRNEMGEEIIFQLPDNIDLFIRDIDVYCSTSFDRKELKKKLEQLAIENNTSGASIYDLGRMLALDTPSEVLDALLDSEIKMQRQRQQEMEHEQQLLQQQLEADAIQKERERQFQAEENAKDREASIVTAEIRASQVPKPGGEDQFLERLDFIREQQEFQDSTAFERERESNKTTLEREKLDLKREELEVKREQASKALQAARENNVESKLEQRRKKREQDKKKKSK